MRVARHLASITVVAALLAWGLAVARSPRRPVGSPPSTQAVEPAPSRITTHDESIDFEGAFVAVDGGLFEVGSAAPGQLKRLLVKPGDHVTKGQALAVVEPNAPTVGAPRFNAKAESAYAEQLSDRLGAALTDHQAALDKAQIALDQAQKEHDANVGRARSQRDRVLNGAPTEQVQQLQHEVDETRIIRDKAKALSDKEQRAYDQGWISRNQATASKTAFEAADAALRKAEHGLEEAMRAASADEARTARETYARSKSAEDRKLQAAVAEFDAVRNGGLAFGVKAVDARTELGVPAGAGFAGKITRWMTVTSPVDGTVLPSAGLGRPCLVKILKDGAKTEFLGRAGRAQTARLRPGMIVRLPDGLAGTVSAIGAADPKTGLVAVHVSCAPRKGLGSPGRASVMIRVVD